MKICENGQCHPNSLLSSSFRSASKLPILSAVHHEAAHEAFHEERQGQSLHILQAPHLRLKLQDDLVHLQLTGLLELST